MFAISWMGEEGDVSRTGILDGRHPFDGHVRVADDPSVDQPGEISKRFGGARHFLLSTLLFLKRSL